MAKRIARPVHLVLAWLFVAGLLAQVFLAGLAVFDSGAIFATHREFGYVLSIVPVVLVITSLVGGFGRTAAIVAGVAFVQFILQSVFVMAREDMPAVAALHPVNGFLILLGAVWLARDARRTWGARVDGPVPAVAESTTG